MKEILNAAEAARIIGVKPDVVRFNLEKGIWKFGKIIPAKVIGQKMNRYEIHTRKMYQYFNIPLPEE